MEAPLRTSKAQILAAAAVLLSCSTGLSLDTGSLLESNTAFFAHQSPTVLAQADDEWGVSPASPKAPDETAIYKSPSRAALYSFLLPGLGEIYVGGSRVKPACFIAAELGIWSTLIFYRKLGQWREDDYIQFATAYAGIDPSGKNDFFYDMVGYYGSRDDYNKISRVYTRTNPFFPETPSWDWQWHDEELQAEYRDMKNESKAAYRNAKFALAAAAVNRVVGMIFAWRSAKNHNRGVANEFSRLDLEVIPDHHATSLSIKLEYTATF
jgi:hypothetical protein